MNQPPYSWRKKKDAPDGLVSFCCSGCESDGKTLLAYADKTRVDEDEVNDEYELKRLPTAEEHICAPAGTEILKKKCIAKMNEYVEKDPTKPITDIYNEVRSDFTKNMGVDERITFLQDIPKFRNKQSKNSKY